MGVRVDVTIRVMVEEVVDTIMSHVRGMELFFFFFFLILFLTTNRCI